VLLRFRRVPRYLKGQRFVHVPIGIGQIDVELEDRRRQRQASPRSTFQHDTATPRRANQRYTGKAA
jgi:hypothetical protein